MISKRRKSLTTGLTDLLDADLLGLLTSDNSQIAPLRKYILTKNREGFLRLVNSLSGFWDNATVINDRVIIDQVAVAM